jgi:colanic acid/amylovoran biosynthesis protein
MRVLIVNTCSTLNRGDAAIVLGQIHLLERLFPTAQISLTSKTPGLDRAFYEPLGVQVLPALVPALSVYRGARDKLSGGLRDALAWRGKARLLKEMGQSDVVLACGGGYFYSYRRFLPGTTFWQNVVHVRLAQCLKKPLLFFPQSFGPLASPLARVGLRSCLAGEGVIGVLARETISHDFLLGMLPSAVAPDVDLCPDMALYLAGHRWASPVAGAAEELPAPLLIVNLRPWAFPGAGDAAARQVRQEAYLAALAAAARTFLKRYGGSVVVIPQALGPDPAEDDRGICQTFARRLREGAPKDTPVHYREPGTDSLDGFMALVSRASLLIGTRLHSCLLALLAGTPALSVGYQYKSRGTLDLLGLGRFDVSIDDVSAGWLADRMAEIMDQRPAVCAEINQWVTAARREIEKKVRLALQRLGELG